MINQINQNTLLFFTTSTPSSYATSKQELHLLMGIERERERGAPFCIHSVSFEYVINHSTLLFFTTSTPTYAHKQELDPENKRDCNCIHIMMRMMMKEAITYIPSQSCIERLQSLQVPGSPHYWSLECSWVLPPSSSLLPGCCCCCFAATTTAAPNS